MEKLIKASGFASPAQGYEVKGFDFNALLLKNPAATFLMRLDSDEMRELGLFAGSILVVDRSIRPKSGALVVISYEGSFLCRQMLATGRGIAFSNGRGDFSPSTEEYEIFGTVRAIVRELV